MEFHHSKNKDYGERKNYGTKKSSIGDFGY